jgi:hypothetical protein
MKAYKFSLPASALLAALTCLFAATTAKAGQAAFVFQSQVDLLDCDGTPCIEATIGDGKKLKLGIDTGNDASVLDTKIAAALGIKPAQPPRTGAPAGMFRMIIPAVQIGSTKLTDVPGIAMDLGEMIEHQQMPHVDGTLAYTAFKDRILQLDFAAHKLRISEPGARLDCAKGCDKISLITFGKEGPPIVVAQGFEVNGKKLSAQVDTMYTGSLLVYSASIEKLGLAAEASSKETELFPLTDGGVPMKVALAPGSETFHRFPLGDGAAKVYFPTPDVHEPDALFDGTVGLALFRYATVTLDFHAMTISIYKIAL